MRLQRVLMRNFRQYKNVDLTFPKSENDIHILKGRNGVGKTTFLNAINWCLYGDEPHAFDKDTGMQKLNLTANEDDKIIVSISVVAENGVEFVFTRTEQNYRTNFFVDVKSKNGESKHVKGEDALNLVDDFVPQVIREFFFFDGEQLDRYFLNNKEHIKHNIFILSHIDILNRMYTHLDKKYKNIRTQASKIDSNVDEINKVLEQKENALKEQEERRKKIIENITISSNKYNELTKELEGMPDTRDLEKQKQILDSEIEKCENKLKEIDMDKLELMISSVPSLFTYDAMKSLYNTIEEKENNKELPYQVDEEIIHESLNEGTCKVCNRHLDESSEKFLRNSLAEYKLSTNQSKLLINIKTPLKVLMNKLNTYPDSLKFLSKHYVDVNNDLLKNKKKLEEIMEKYIGYEDITDKLDLRDKLKDSIDNDKVTLGIIKKEIDDLQKCIEKLNKELDKVMKNKKKLELLNKKTELCKNARDLANDTKNEIMHSTKWDIEQYTRSAFLDLIWKKETYETVNIDDSYQLQLINKKTKKNSLGTASAAERELLTLSFTLGIHSISGFDGPLLIDTPLARISDSNRVNFVETLLEISKIKQIIIIVTPAEYSDDVAPILDTVKNKHEIIMNKDETISEMKEME